MPPPFIGGIKLKLPKKKAGNCNLQQVQERSKKWSVLGNHQCQQLTAPLSNPGVLVVAPVIVDGEVVTSLGTSALIFEKHTSPKEQTYIPEN